jgi:hypothetical protein
MYMILSVVIPGEPTLNDIYINVDGIVNDFVADTWLVFVIDGSVARGIDASVEIYPVRSAVVFTTLPDIPTAEDVDVAAKLIQRTV